MANADLDVVIRQLAKQQNKDIMAAAKRLQIAADNAADSYARSMRNAAEAPVKKAVKKAVKKPTKTKA